MIQKSLIHMTIDLFKINFEDYPFPSQMPSPILHFIEKIKTTSKIRHPPNKSSLGDVDAFMKDFLIAPW